MSDKDKEIIIRDMVNITGVQIQKAKVDNIIKIKDSDDSSLNVVADLTFSGYQTKNHTIYLPDEFQNNVVPSFIYPFRKPLIKHHDENQDAIGRVLKTKYIDLKDTYPKDISSLLDSAQKLQTRMRDATQPEEYAKLAQKMGKKYLELMKYDGYRGAGVIRAHLKVSDKDAIQKFLDERFTTFSVSYSYDSIVCSECGQDIKKKGICDCQFQRGKIGEDSGLPIVLIPLGQRAVEVSVVNSPALEGAQVVKLDASFEDAVNKESNLYYFNMGDQEYDATNGDKISIKDSVNDIFSADQSTFSKNPNVITVLDNTKNTNKENEEDTKARDMKMKLLDLLKDSKESYKVLKKYLPESSALTDESLEKLDDSVFVGDNRTLPCPDKEHYQAVLKVLDEVQDKESKLYKLVVKELEGIKDSFKDESDSLKERVQKLEDAIAEKDIIISKYEKKISSLESEVETLTAANVQAVKDAKSATIDKLIEVKKRLGLKIADESKEKESLSSRSIESLSEQIADLENSAPEKKVDESTEKKLEPDSVKEGEVLKDKEEKKEEKQQTYNLKDYQKVVDEYNQIKSLRGTKKAKEWLASNAAYLPAGFKVE